MGNLYLTPDVAITRRLTEALRRLGGHAREHHVLGLAPLGAWLSPGRPHEEDDVTGLCRVPGRKVREGRR
jgi:hypothetical protein